MFNYRKCGKIHWAEHSWFQPYELFRGNTFAVPLSVVLLFKFSQENFYGTYS